MGQFNHLTKTRYESGLRREAEEVRRIVAAGRCPSCGGTIIEYPGIKGWHQCENVPTLTRSPEKPCYWAESVL